MTDKLSIRCCFPWRRADPCVLRLDPRVEQRDHTISAFRQVVQPRFEGFAGPNGRKVSARTASWSCWGRAGCRRFRSPDGDQGYPPGVLSDVLVDRFERERQILPSLSHSNIVNQNLIVHRDLTPRDVLVMDDGAPKLIDFGIARRQDEAAKSNGETLSVGQLSLTPGFAAA